MNFQLFNRFRAQHICLLFHSLREGGIAPAIHPELSVELSQVETLILQLKEEGFHFCLPWEGAGQKKTCSITFDDGYFNNTLFLSLAEKYHIPFIIFVSTFNVVSQMPFIWDIMKLKGIDDWGFARKNYLDMYEQFKPHDFESLMQFSHRPFTSEELLSFSVNPNVYLGLHTHSHQPLVGDYVDHVDWELDTNLEYLKAFKNILPKDVALPNGMYTQETIKKLRRRFDRIYTIQGGGFSLGASIINRISLINPHFGGDLMLQITKSFSFKRKILRNLKNVKYQWMSP